MLRSLHVRNYVLIDSLDISFPEGLVIITGQTGAGKSILLGALSLLTGAKADASIISAGADSCVVEAEFSIDDSPEIRALLDEADVEWDSGQLLIRRVVHSTGRSRSFINDSPVQVQLLSDIAGQLVDIHSQHQSLMLTSRAFQLSLLDNFAGLGGQRSEAVACWQRLQAVRAGLADARRRLERIQSEGDYARSQWEQLDRANLRDGELEELEEEQKQLANAEEIKTNLGEALSLLDPDDSSGVPGISAALRQAQRLLEKTSVYVPSLSELGERIDSARIEIDDICSEIDRAGSSVVLSQERLAEVEDRISLLLQLMRKHDVRTVAELIAVRESYGQELFDGSALEEKAAALEKELNAATQAYDSVCSKLHAARAEAAPRLASEIEASIHGLELEKAVFTVELSEGKPGPAGTDSVMFCFSATGKTAPVDLAKCASGGEISRIMLCLKAMMALYEGMPTMIFDEIDTGVSGSAAHKMGALICEMGASMQVFAITHLPQVAAKGSAHYVVEKTEDAAGRTVSSIREVRGKDRVTEIARLLSGAAITPEAIANAESLLSQ
ncbi:MAG: DNA repair protein RecN [Bacteroidales bacterium]|nr:DNA repair protein RecN [Bacteroidales bacterium]